MKLLNYCEIYVEECTLWRIYEVTEISIFINASIAQENFAKKLVKRYKNQNYLSRHNLNKMTGAPAGKSIYQNF